MPLSPAEESDLNIALAEIRSERFRSLEKMFQGTQLVGEGLQKMLKNLKKQLKRLKTFLQLYLE